MLSGGRANSNRRQCPDSEVRETGAANSGELLDRQTSVSPAYAAYARARRRVHDRWRRFRTPLSPPRTLGCPPRQARAGRTDRRHRNKKAAGNLLRGFRPPVFVFTSSDGQVEQVFLPFSRCSGHLRIYPIARADPPSWEGQNGVCYRSAADGFRFKSSHRRDG